MSIANGFIKSKRFRTLADLTHKLESLWTAADTVEYTDADLSGVSVANTRPVSILDEEDFNELTTSEKNNGYIYYVYSTDATTGKTTSYIYTKGITYGVGDPSVELTWAEYQALPSTKETDGITYYITDRDPSENISIGAESVTYGNTTVDEVLDDILDDGGGHTIENDAGTDMTQRDNLQFLGAYVTDDSTNNRTKVDVVRSMTKAQFNALSAAEKVGIINVTDAGNILNAGMVGYDNTESGLTATDVQDAIDELASDNVGHVIQNAVGTDMTQRENLQFTGNGVSVTDDAVNGKTIVDISPDAGDISYDNTSSGLSATRVQGAIDEVSAKALYKYPRFKNLGTFTSTAQLETFLSNFGVSTGNFDGDIQVGDYATIAGYKCYVAGFDTEYDKGDISLVTHHVTFIANFGDSKMNETDTTAGGYEGATTMQNFLSGKATELEAICGSHLLTRRCITSTHVGSNGKSDAWDWNSHKLTLLTEQQLYGSMQWGNVYDTGEGYEKLPIFNYVTPTRIFKRNHLWLRGVASATAFCYLDFDGRPNGYRASVNRKTVALFCLG